MDNGACSYRHFLEGDENAFSQILEMYRDSLIFFIDRTVHNPDIAEDIAADCFAELIVHPRRYNFSVSFKTYLFAIAHHKTVDYIRHKSRYVITEYDDRVVKSSSYESFEKSVFDKEEARIVNSALEKINSDYREALHLVFFEGQSYEETARIMKKSRKQIDNLVYRGKKALRAILEKEGYEYEK